MNGTTNFDPIANDEALVRECLDAVGQEAFSRLLDGIANVSMERDMADSAYKDLSAENERLRVALDRVEAAAWTVSKASNSGAIGARTRVGAEALFSLAHVLVEGDRAALEGADSRRARQP